MRFIIYSAIAVLASLSACSKEPPRPSPDAVVHPAPVEVKGRGTLRFADRSLTVGPMVGHAAGMDLYVQCRAQVAQAKEAGGETPPLCYEDKRRSRFTRVRIEYNPRMSGALVFGMLRPKHGAAHIIVEPSGSTYQVLDLAYAVRRDGQVQQEEIRIMSGNENRHKELSESLSQHFPHLEIEVVNVELPGRPTKDTTGSP